jgi:hypothetical protein
MMKGVSGIAGYVITEYPKLQTAQPKTAAETISSTSIDFTLASLMPGAPSL